MPSANLRLMSSIRPARFARTPPHPQGNPMSQVRFETSHGPFTIELSSQEAPVTVENFLAYVDSGFFDGTIFHRVIPGFMVQGGGFTADMKQKETKAPIKNEATNGLKNLRGTLSMARTNDINSATSQFFINVADNEFLNHKGTSNYGYAVFGRVIDGMPVIDKIVGVPTGSRGPHQDVPMEAVVIQSAKRVAGA
jgi:cyclophilin family peptidyl-prolyl cis-trans isomerase